MIDPPSSPRTGVLLVNLGSPDSPAVGDVRRFLRQFLSDPRVIDLPPLGRWLLLNAVILPFRSPKSAAAWRTIWSPDGSPLLVHGRALAEALAAELPEYDVELAMRYGTPSMEGGLDRLVQRGAERIVVFPLYPQHASSSTGTVVEEAYRLAGTYAAAPTLAVVPAFYDDPGFLDVWIERAREATDGFVPEHTLMSFHGLPERHMREADPTRAHCLVRADCCDAALALDGPAAAARTACYRAQCLATARGIAERLGLAPEDWTLAFQSRLTREPWLTPSTQTLVPELAARGVKRLAVFSPAFVADCLETLEELGVRAVEDFRAAGGDELRFVPSLNAHPAWVRAAAELVRRTTPPEWPHGGRSHAAHAPA